LRSRFISRFSSRFCSFFSCLVNFSPGAVDDVEAALGDNVDSPSREAPADEVVAFGDAEAEGIGSTFRGWNFCACDLNFRLVSVCVEPPGTSGDRSGGAVTLV